MTLSTVKWAQWDETQSRDLLGLFICVCIAIIAQNRPHNFPSYPPDNHHCSNDVYLREGGVNAALLTALSVGEDFWDIGEAFYYTVNVCELQPRSCIEKFFSFCWKIVLKVPEKTLNTRFRESRFWPCNFQQLQRVNWRGSITDWGRALPYAPSIPSHYDASTTQFFLSGQPRGRQYDQIYKFSLSFSF